MAKATLPTNYRDDILNVSTEGKRKYRMNYNDDGTVSFVDVTPYDQEGSDFGAGDINATNEAVNQSFDKSKLIRDMDAINALTQEGFAPDALALKDVNDSLGGLRFGTDGEGNYGYFGDDDVLVPFKSGTHFMQNLGSQNTINLGFIPNYLSLTLTGSSNFFVLHATNDEYICGRKGGSTNNVVSGTVTNKTFSVLDVFTIDFSTKDVVVNVKSSTYQGEYSIFASK